MTDTTISDAVTDDHDHLAEVLLVLDKTLKTVEDFETKVTALSSDTGTLANALYEHLSTWPPTDDDEQCVDELATWVNEWLIPTFALDIQLKGWRNEPALQSEMRALWMGYQQMAIAEAASFDPLAWHDFLDRVISRIDAHKERRQRVVRQGRLHTRTDPH